MVATPSGILGIYNQCVSESVKTLRRLGYSVKPVKLSHKQNDGVLVLSLEEPFYFQDWPHKSRTKKSKEKIDILAQIHESISVNDAACVKSTLELNYFKRVDETYLACDSIHYDFAGEVQGQHPICHAQNSNRIIRELPEGFRDDCDCSNLEHRLRIVRIPTAFVNLAGLIDKVTADHLAPADYDEFWDSCHKFVEKIPHHSNTGLFTEITASGGIRSCNWYPRGDRKKHIPEQE